MDGREKKGREGGREEGRSGGREEGRREGEIGAGGSRRRDQLGRPWTSED